MEEYWKHLKGPYYVSSYGRIRRNAYTYESKMSDGSIRRTPIPDKILIGPKLSPKGYQRIHLEGRTHFVHVLVARAFLGEPVGNVCQVNHIDGNKCNNNINNLEYVTNQQNRDHAVKLNLHPNRSNGFAKISVEQVREIARKYAAGTKQRVLAAEYGVCQQTISSILRSKYAVT